MRAMVLIAALLAGPAAAGPPAGSFTTTAPIGQPYLPPANSGPPISEDRTPMERPRTGDYAPASARVPEPAAQTPHQQACAQRYHSYDPATDSYRARNGRTVPCRLAVPARP